MKQDIEEPHPVRKWPARAFLMAPIDDREIVMKPKVSVDKARRAASKNSAFITAPLYETPIVPRRR